MELRPTEERESRTSNRTRIARAHRSISLAWPDPIPHRGNRVWPRETMDLYARQCFRGAVTHYHVRIRIMMYPTTCSQTILRAHYKH